MSEASELTHRLYINQQRLSSLLEDLEDDVLQRIFAIYKRELTEKLNQISGYIESKAYKILECESHALKGASQNLGIDQMGEIMAVIELAALENDHKKAELSLQMAFKYHELINELERLG